MAIWQKYMGIGEPRYSLRIETPFMAGQARELVQGIWKRKVSFWEEQEIFSKGVDAKALSFVAAVQWRRTKWYLLSEISLQHPLLPETLHLIYNFRKFRKQGFFSSLSLPHPPPPLPPAPPALLSMGFKPKPETMECKQKNGLGIFSGFFLNKLRVLDSSFKLISSAWQKCKLAKFMENVPPHYCSREESEVSWSLLMLHCSEDKKDNTSGFVWVVDNVMLAAS